MPLSIISSRLVLIDDRGKVVMGRVIRISAILMGVLLLALTGGLRWTHSQEQRDILVLLERANIPNRLSWLDPNAPQLTPIITDVEIITVAAMSPSREWLYFMGGKKENYGADIWNGSLYRVRIGELPEVVVPHVDGWQIGKSSDRAWIFYPQEYQATDGSKTIEFVRMELATAKTEVLMTVEMPNDVFVWRDWSHDPEWIKYKVVCRDLSNPCTEYFRFSSGGTVAERIPDRPYEIEFEGAWLTQVTQDGYDLLYWREADGTRRPATTDWTSLGFLDLSAGVYAWLPDEPLLIVSLDHEYVFWAVRPDDPNPIWTLEDKDYPRLDLENRRVLFQNRYDGGIWRMGLDGGELFQIVATAVWRGEWKLDITGEWIIYRISEGEWRRTSIDGLVDELIYQSANSVPFLTQSPDGAWFILVEYDSATGHAIFRTQRKGEVVEQLTPALAKLGVPSEQYAIFWMSTPKN